MNLNKLELVPGWVNKNDDSINLLSLATGAAGILWAVDDQNMMLNKWIEENQANIINISKRTNVLGVFNGIGGVAQVLEKLNYNGLADQLIDLISKKVDLTIEDNSLATGLSGLAFVLRKRHPEITKEILDLLLSRWDSVNFSNFEKEDVGLLTGWGGVSYLFWSLGEKKKAEEIITYILQKHSEGKDNLAVTDRSRGFERLIPYLENGTFGLALLMHKYMREDSLFKQKYQSLFEKLKRTCFTYCTYMETLMSGYSGVLPLANALAKDGDSTILDYSLSALNQYLVAKGNEILLPGKYGYKLSLDFSYGSAGLLTLLKSLDQGDEFSWLPLK